MAAIGPAPVPIVGSTQASDDVCVAESVHVDGDGNSVVGPRAHHNALGEHARVIDNSVIFQSHPPNARSYVRLVSCALGGWTSILLGVLAVYLRVNGSAGSTIMLPVSAALVGAVITLAIWPRGADSRKDQVMAYGAREANAREHLIAETDRLWVRGALHHSLQSVIRLEIGLTDQPGAIKDPFGSARLQNITDSKTLPDGTRLTALLGNRGRGRLLVVGAPGAGKTTHLLSLAEDQISRARNDQYAPVPMVLLLSTWAKEHRESRLVDWICAEARQRYMIETTVMMTWLATGRVILLLDGLDEVKREADRSQCLADIEDFCTDPEYQGCGLVITCRTAEFQELGRRVSASKAVRVMPLSESQVQQVLSSGGNSLTALAHATQEDNELAALLTTPLMLGVAVLAFSDLAPGTRLPAGDQRDTLFGLYVHRMLFRNRALRESADQPGNTTPPAPKETYYYLVWLARLMTRQGQTIFYPDLLTPMWLPGRRSAWQLTRQRGFPARIARWLGWDHTSTGLVGGRLAALVGAVSGAPLGALVGGPSGALAAAAITALTLGTGVALVFGVLLQSSLVERLFTPVVGHDTYGIYAASNWKWSLREASRGLVTWMLFGGAVGVCLFIAGASRGNYLLVACVLALGGILSGGTVPDHEKPPIALGGALAASLSRLYLLLSVLLCIVLPGAALLALLHGSWEALIAALPITVAFMLTAGPGRAWLRHRAAYYGARKSKLLPRDLGDLMLRGEDRIILRQVGGGYMFLHRDLQQYLTDRSPEQGPGECLDRPGLGC